MSPLKLKDSSFSPEKKDGVVATVMLVVVNPAGTMQNTRNLIRHKSLGIVMQLDSKVVVITGAARGLGRAYAVAMAAEGASVFVSDINDCSETVAEVEAAGGRIASTIADISDMKSCQAMADAVVDTFGKIDVLVNNAALYATLKGSRFEDLEEAQWDAVMNVNIKGVWQCCKAVVRTGSGSLFIIKCCISRAFHS